MLQYRLWYFHILFDELGEAKKGADKYIPQSVQLERECPPICQNVILVAKPLVFQFSSISDIPWRPPTE